MRRKITMSSAAIAILSLAARSSGSGVRSSRATAFASNSASSSTQGNVRRSPRLFSSSSLLSSTKSSIGSSSASSLSEYKINLLTLPLPELETLLKSWNHPPFRARQIHRWIFQSGVTSFDEMTDLPLDLRSQLGARAAIGSLQLQAEQLSSDGTVKRAYRLHDGQLIESVLMPYDDGRRTACVSSQAGCAMGCVFCATGQMGFARQLTSDEIFEQVATFANELKKDNGRLSNVVMMGMGEPLANYRNVISAIRRMNQDLGISGRKITVSTVGIVPNIRKLITDDRDLQVRLAISLHCADDDERTALLPANRRYGGLDELMSAVREYISVKKSRVTFEWALIENQNDSVQVARSLGRLLQRHDIRPDMAHVNLIPLNPTGGYGGSPSGRANVQRFVQVLEKEYGLSATPRMRRGIDIDAGCGQLKAAVHKKERRANDTARDELLDFASASNGPQPTNVGVYEDDDYDVDVETLQKEKIDVKKLSQGSIVDFSIDTKAIDLDSEYSEEFADPTFEDEFELAEAERLIALVKGSSLSSFNPTSSNNPTAITTTTTTTNTVEITTTSKPTSIAATTTSITDENSIREAKKRRKKLLKQLKAIQKLKDMKASGKELNTEQLEKISKETMWTIELESVEHNLM